MKNIVLYKSKYGNTLQYATWIAEELGWELRDFSDFKKKEVEEYDKVIFGTGVYMSRMNKLKKALKIFQNKSIIIFACAGNNNVDKDIQDIKTNNFKNDELSFHHFFYLPGGVDFSKITGIMKVFLNFFRKMLEKKKDKTRDEEEIMKGFTNPTNLVDKKHITDIVEFARQ